MLYTGETLVQFIETGELALTENTQRMCWNMIYTLAYQSARINLTRNLDLECRRDIQDPSNIVKITSIYELKFV